MFLYTIYSGATFVSTKCILQVYDFISPDPTAIPITNHVKYCSITACTTESKTTFWET